MPINEDQLSAIRSPRPPVQSPIRLPKGGSRPRLFNAPEWSWFRAGDTGWWVLPKWREALLGPTGLRLEEWRAEGRLTTIKAGPHRVVYRADLARGSVFVKHFLVPDLRTKLRQWFRRGKGRNEARRAAHLSRIGVQTITPIALGERRRGAFLLENFLITPAIPDTLPLDEFVERSLPRFDEPRRRRIARALAKELGRFTARLHQHQIVHEDFHPGNILVRLVDDRPVLAMIDLDALRVRKRLSWRAARANLALLNHYFWTRCGLTDRRRFLRAYLAGRRGGPTIDPRAFAREIEQATRAWAERLWTHWGKRCRRRNKYFETYQNGFGRWAIAVKDMDASVVETLLADPDAPFRPGAAKIVKNSRTTAIAELSLPVAGADATVIYKRFNRRQWIDPFLCLFRPSRGWQAWQAAQHLVSRAIPTPRTLAVFNRPAKGWLGLPGDTYVIALKQESLTLYEYAHDVLPTLEPRARRRASRRLIAALAHLTRRLHERSLSHRDLKAANVRVSFEPGGDPASDEPRLRLIDLVGVRHLHPLPKHRKRQNLARLALSLVDVFHRSDALRFLLCYDPRADWKTLWREFDRGAARKIARNRRNGRELT